ncbi:hypothetical protein GCM10027194_12460 [Thalassiella azotivora]
MPVAVAGWCLVVAGAGHLTVAALGALSPVPDGERVARAAMDATTVTLAGIERSLWQLFTGFSVLMGLLLLATGGLLLHALRRAPALVDESRAALTLLLGVLAAGWVTSLLLLPSPPIVLLGVAALAVALALRHPSTGAGDRT